MTWECRRQTGASCAVPPGPSFSPGNSPMRKVPSLLQFGRRKLRACTGPRQSRPQPTHLIARAVSLLAPGLKCSAVQLVLTYCCAEGRAPTCRRHGPGTDLEKHGPVGWVLSEARPTVQWGPGRDIPERWNWRGDQFSPSAGWKSQPLHPNLSPAALGPQGRGKDALETAPPAPSR